MLVSDNFQPIQPSRPCKTCNNYYPLNAFGMTPRGRMKYSCIPCEQRKKEMADHEKYLKGSLHRETKPRVMKAVNQRILINLSSSNKQVDLNKITSLTLDFNR